MTYRIPVPEFERLEWRAQSPTCHYVDMLGLRLIISSHAGDARYAEGPYWSWWLSTPLMIDMFKRTIMRAATAEISGLAGTEDDARRAAYDAALRLIDAALLDIGGVRV